MITPNARAALILLTAVGVTASFGGGYVVCPQQVQGLPRAVISTLVGIPVGNALALLVLVAQCLGFTGWRGPRIAAVARVVVERAGMGALYGTLLATWSATIYLARVSPSCQPDLLQTIGNGAVWGTMASFMFSFPTVAKAIQLDAHEAPNVSGSRRRRKAIWLSILIGLTTAISLSKTLAAGIGWPS